MKRVLRDSVRTTVLVAFVASSVVGAAEPGGAVVEERSLAWGSECKQDGVLVRQDRLSLADAKSHGAAVRSVAWCCPCSMPGLENKALLAVGGDAAGAACVTARIYVVDKLSGHLIEIVQDGCSCRCTVPRLPLSTAWKGDGKVVSAVSWLCTRDHQLLALAGYKLHVPSIAPKNPDPADVIVFNIEGVTRTCDGDYVLTVNAINSFNHKAPVHALAWIPARDNECEPPGLIGYLVVGGQKACDGASIRIVPYCIKPCQTNPVHCDCQTPCASCSACGSSRHCRMHSSSFSDGLGGSKIGDGGKDDPRASRMFVKAGFDTACALSLETGATICALDVCTGPQQRTLVAAGGRATCEVCPGANVFVYALDCKCGYPTVESLAQGHYCAGSVEAVRWCCTSKYCESLPPLAVGGGSADKRSKNAVLYRVARDQELHEFASFTPSMSGLGCVAGIIWNTPCPCTYLTIAGVPRKRCEGNEHNIVVYKKNAQSTTFEQACSVKFDSSVTALDWCRVQGPSSLLAVGSTGTRCHDDHNCCGNDDCARCRRTCEVAVYKAFMCGLEIEPVCMRESGMPGEKP